MIAAVVVHVLASPREIRLRAARVSAWVGLLAPLAIAQQRTAADVASSPANTANVIEAAVSVLALAVALLLGHPKVGRVTCRELILCFYLLVALASASWSVNPTATLLKAGQLGLAYVLILLLVRLSTVGQLARGLSAVTSLLCLSALVGLAVRSRSAYAPTSSGYETTESNTRRLSGLFPAISPDLLGLVAASALILLAAGAYPRLSRNPLVRAAAATGCAAALMLSRSRTGFLVAAIGIAIVIIVEHRDRWRALSPLPGHPCARRHRGGHRREAARATISAVTRRPPVSAASPVEPPSGTRPSPDGTSTRSPATATTPATASRSSWHS